MSARTPAELKKLFESDTFARDTTCTGPLGPEYTLSGTRLRLWTPTAQSVCVNLYRKGNGGVCMGTLPLERGPQGVWSIYLPGDQHGRYYTFTVTVDGVSRETGDPYARAAGVNGTRSMIVDLARTAPSGWERDVRPVIPPEQRAVWEVSVRDFSQDAASGVRPAWRGKFMAFTQQGTTLHGDGIHPTCLNYLKRLGVKYVQLMHLKREVLPSWAEVLFSVNLRDPVESPAPMMLMQNILQHFVRSWMTIRSITRWQNLERSISAVAEPSRIFCPCMVWK